MNVWPRSLTLLIPFLLIGCNGDKAGGAPADPAKPPTDGLKALGKEDTKIGKPNKFNPKVAPLAKGDTVWVVYTGKLKTGKVIDTNDPAQKEGAVPYPVQVGAGMVIQGWEEGLVGMLPGGERKLSIPWKMAYKDRGRDNIPPFSDLYFDIKVVDYVKYGQDMFYSAVDTKVGTGPKVKEDSTITIHTVVKDCAGNVLDDTHKGKPVTAKLGQQNMQKTIEDGVLGMQKGGVRELWIPPAIGFPPSTRTGVDANTLFYVTIELLDVK